MVLDPSHGNFSFLRGYRVESLAKSGLSDKRLMSVDFTYKVFEPRAHRAMFDLDHAAPVTQA